MRGKKVLPVVLATNFLTVGAMAGDLSNYAKKAKNAIDEKLEISVSADINGSVSYDGDDESYNLAESTVTLSMDWDNKVRAVITANLEKLKEQGELDFIDDFEVEEFIRDAYIEIKNVAGTPVAMIVGKHRMAFGQNYQNMPVHNESPLSNLQEIEEVVGLTLKLNHGVLGQIEASFFETEAGDLGIGDETGYSIRLSRALTDKISASVSYASMTNQDGSEEDRMSVGIVARVNDQIVAYAEAINSDDGSSDYWAFTLGAAYELDAKNSISVEYNTLEDELDQFGIAFSHKLSESTTVSLGLRHTQYEDGSDDDTSVTASVRHTMGKTLKRRRQLAK